MLELTDEQKIQIAKWEQDNWVCAAFLQKECISYEHYLTEVLNEIESDIKEILYVPKSPILGT